MRSQAVHILWFEHRAPTNQRGLAEFLYGRLNGPERIRGVQGNLDRLETFINQDIEDGWRFLRAYAAQDCHEGTPHLRQGVLWVIAVSNCIAAPPQEAAPGQKFGVFGFEADPHTCKDGAVESRSGFCCQQSDLAAVLRKAGDLGPDQQSRQGRCRCGRISHAQD